jgi:hypothetical protein
MIKDLLITYTCNLLYALDVFANALIGGDRRETISSRLGKGQRAGKPVHTVLAKVVNLLFYVLFREKNHCTNWIQQPEDYYSISSVLARHRK